MPKCMLASPLTSGGGAVLAYIVYNVIRVAKFWNLKHFKIPPPTTNLLLMYLGVHCIQCNNTYNKILLKHFKVPPPPNYTVKNASKYFNRNLLRYYCCTLQQMNYFEYNRDKITCKWCFVLIKILGIQFRKQKDLGTKQYGYLIQKIRKVEVVWILDSLTEPWWILYT